jgi:hypothetical protein
MTVRAKTKNAGTKGAGAIAEGARGRSKTGLTPGLTTGSTTGLTPSERIDRHIAGIADWRGKVLGTIRRIVLEADPAVTEDWKWMGSPVWYCDGMVCLANAHIGKVKWTFAKGAHFADADGLFNAGLEGNDWRAIDVFEKDRLGEDRLSEDRLDEGRLDEAALLRLVKAAIAYNRSQAKGKEKKKAVNSLR